MAKIPFDSQGDEDSSETDASWLAGTEAEPPASAPRTSGDSHTISPEEAYALEGEDPTATLEPESIPILPPIPPVTPRRPKPADEEPVRPAPAAGPRIESDSEISRRATPPSPPTPPPSPEPAVPVPVESWSRRAEWGRDLIRLAIVELAIVFEVYLALAASFSMLAVVFVAVGVLALLVLSYPILLTVERPVRVTPEQAIQDFYAAASHHFPHYRRMWLLLSLAGRNSVYFASYEAFRAYWREKIARFRGERANSFVPLKFSVEDFRGEKSAKLTSVDVAFTLKVSLRDNPGGEPIQTHRIQMGLAKGPDKMWYLNDGTLPGGR